MKERRAGPQKKARERSLHREEAMREKLFRDAVHGDIALDFEKEGLLLDTREFQRLRGIRQLGTAYLVYPSGMHSRFEHSIGTCWMAKRILRSLEERDGILLSAEERDILYCAALLHDISHIPFGHTFEDERRIFPRHDEGDRFRYFLKGGELGRRLQDLGCLDDVLDLLTGVDPRGFLREIISGTICADLLDYLARDSYFCGIRQIYDERIFRYFKIDGGKLYIDAQKDGAVREDVLSEVVQLLRLRYFLSERVYFHHAKTVSGAMISKAVEIGVRNSLRLEDMYYLKDEGLLALLYARFAKDRALVRLIEHYEARRLYKRCYVLTRHIGPEKQDELVKRFHFCCEGREEAEEYLTRRLNFKQGEIIVYCPSPDMSLKEAKVLVKVDRYAPRPLSELNIPEINALQERHKNLWKFYVFVSPERMDRSLRISRVCEEYFLEANHLPELETGQLFFSF
jgi:HD superfamily phosphohydrolase